MISNRRSPLIVSAAAASRLPRWALLIVLATFVLAGFDGHYFWNGRDEQVFALAWEMARGSAEVWFLPALAGEAYLETAPGIAWPAALLLKLLGSEFNPVTLARIPNLIWFLGATGCVWYGAWHLARREEAQPIALVFGDEASPRNYGRTVADSATLLFVATFGLVSRFHEIGLPAVLLALVPLLLMGLIWSLTHLRPGSAVAGSAIGLSFLCATPYWTLVILVMGIVVLFVARAFRPFLRVRLAVMLGTAAAVSLIWPLGAVLSGAGLDAWIAAFSALASSSFGIPRIDSWIWIARNIVWYLCPVWPFAIYAVYAWHRVIGRSHLILSIVAVLVPLALLPISGSSPEFTLTAMAAPAAILAAFGIAALKANSFENILDWFSAAVFSLAVLGLWGYFYAWSTGFPVKMAASVKRLAPGAVPWVETTLIVCAAALTIGWFAIVVWRLRRRPKALWRGPWLAALGLTLIWTVGTALYSGLLDGNRSYFPVAREITGKLMIFGQRPGRGCVEARDAPTELRGILSWFGVNLAAPGEGCRYAVERYAKGEDLPADAVGLPTLYPRSGERYVIRPGKADPAKKEEQPRS